jgi:molybdenum-dependent DNA-binding transcriptional regulator ModE
MVRRTGGKGGGCSLVSDEGKWLVGAFGAVDREAAAFLKELFARHLGRLCRPADELGAIGDAANVRGEQ